MKCREGMDTLSDTGKNTNLGSNGHWEKYPLFWGCETTLSYRTHIPILGGKSPLSNASQDNVLDSWRLKDITLGRPIY